MKQAVISALALALVATPALVTTPPSTQIASTSVDCGSSFVSFLEHLSRRVPAVSGDQLAALHRGSLRIFYACDSGHLADAQSKFVELERRVDGPAGTP
jgi:hypothetical protein